MKTYAALPPSDESSLDPNSSYAHLLKLIEGAPRVVDFGCGPGNLSRLLSLRGCNVVGVDANPDHAALAREYCSSVIVANLETESLRSLFPSERFDVAIFADILEHLRDPGRLLSEAPRILRPGGYVLASIPNIAHGAVRLALLRGDFDYQELGILDDTHLRFFTRKSMEALFERCGLLIESIDRTKAPVFDVNGTLVPPIRREDMPADVAALVEADFDAETLQFIVKAIPSSSGNARYAALRRKGDEREARIRELEAALESAQARLSERASVESEVAALRQEAALLHERLQARDRDVEIAEGNATTAADELARTSQALAESAAERAAADTEHAATAARLREGFENETAARASLEVELARASEEVTRLRYRLGEVEAGLAEAREYGSRLEQEYEAAISALSGHETAREAADAALAQASEELVQLRRRVAEGESLLSSAAADRDKLEAELRATIQALSERESAVSSELKAANERLLTERREFDESARERDATLSTLQGLLNDRAIELTAARQREDALRSEQSATELLWAAKADEMMARIREGEAIREQLHEERLQLAQRLREAAADREEAVRLEIADADRQAAAAIERLEEMRGANAALERELEALREAALADKLVMREYANDLNERSERLAATLQAEAADRERALRSEIDVAVGHSAAAIQQLEQMRGTNEALEAELEALRQAALAGELVLREYVNDLSERSERTVSELRAAVASLTESERSARTLLESVERRLAEETQRMRATEASLRERLADAEQQLLAQAEEFVAAMQAESAELATLVDTVQSSRFWKMKRWFSRLRARTFGR